MDSNASHQLLAGSDLSIDSGQWSTRFPAVFDRFPIVFDPLSDGYTRSYEVHYARKRVVN